MTPQHPIPPHEHDNVLHVYWVMLAECESRADRPAGQPGHDPYLRLVVKGGYDVLNRIGFTTARPAWEEREKRS